MYIVFMYFVFTNFCPFLYTYMYLYSMSVSVLFYDPPMFNVMCDGVCTKHWSLSPLTPAIVYTRSGQIPYTNTSLL